MQHKYKFSPDKQDKVCGAVRDAINTRGRNLRWNLKFQAMKKRFARKDDEEMITNGSIPS